MNRLISKVAILIALTSAMFMINETNSERLDNNDPCIRACMHDPGSGCDGQIACCKSICA